jgi:hypothetical protein
MRFGWSLELPAEADGQRGVIRDLQGTRDVLIALLGPGGVRSAPIDGSGGWDAVGEEGGSVTGTALWASSARDIWVVVGDGYDVRHWDGTRWTTVILPVEGLIDIWGSSSTDVYAVGRQGIVHHDGTTWSVERIPPGASGLRAIGGAGSDAIYAVGQGGSMLRRDGRRWSTMDSGTTEDLVGVWTDSSGELWTISATRARRWDGERWRIMDTVEADANGRAWLGGTGAHDVWTSTGPSGQVRRYDGAAWSTLLDAPQTGAQPLWVDGRATAVGHQGLDEDATGALMRWYGAGNGPVLVGSGDYREAWASGQDWIAVGSERATGEGVALHADGRRFRFAESMENVVGFGDDRAYASDRLGNIHRWDGSVWSPEPTAPGGKVIDLSASGSADLHAVVTDDRTSSVVHFDGERWAPLPPVPAPCGSSAYEVWASSPSDVFVVGIDLLARFDGTRWTCYDDEERDQQFFSVWGSGSTDVWVFQGSASTASPSRLLHWDGASWASQITGGVGLLTGTAPDDVFLGNSSHFDGRTWTPIRGSRIRGTVIAATESRLLTNDAIFEPGGLGQFVRTRFWNGRARERGCDDRVDDDGDGLTDGDDPDCQPGAAERRP